MRPVRLTLTAFGPYAQTEQLDFDALGELGLFVVAGPTGSGKSTIFDGLYFALYGSLPGRRSGYRSLRSDHAEGTVESCVVFDFVAAGALWRVERSPSQRRAKVRGSGTTEVPQRATLYRIDDGVAVAQANKTTEVDARCRELVGLTGNQFERVALLPQGDFSRVLTEPTRSRRELLRALFSSTVFADASDRLAKQARKIEAADLAADTQFVAAVDALTPRIKTALVSVQAWAATDSAATGGTLAPGQPAHSVDTTAAEPTGLAAHAPPDDSVASPEAMIDAAIESLSAAERGPLTERELTVAQLQSAAEAAHADHLRVCEIARRERRRAEIDAELTELGRLAPEIQVDRARLDAARAAIPVVQAAASLNNQQSAGRDAAAELERDRSDCLTMLGRVGVDQSVPDGQAGIDELAGRLEQQRSDLDAYVDVRDRAHRAASRVDDLAEQHRRALATCHRTDADLDSARTRRGQADNQRHDYETQADVETRRHALDAARHQLDQRRELERLDVDHAEARQTDRQLRSQIAELERQRDQAIQAHHRLDEINSRARELSDQLVELERLRSARHRFDDLQGQLVAARARQRSAIGQADSALDRFVRSTAGRLAADLDDGEPCPVCGSCEHPAPATAHDEPVSESELAERQRLAKEATEHKAGVEAAIAELFSAVPDLAATDVEALGEQLESIKARALVADRTADQTRSEAGRVEAITANITALAADAEQQTVAAASIADRRSQLAGALGDASRRSTADLSAVVEAAAERVEQALEAQRRVDQLTDEIARIEKRIDTLQVTRDAAQSEFDGLDARLGDARRDQLQYQTELDRAQATLGPDPDTDPAAISAALVALNRLAKSTAAEQVTRPMIQRAESQLALKLDASPFAHVDQAVDAALDEQAIAMLADHIEHHDTRVARLQGQALELGDPPVDLVDVEAAASKAAATRDTHSRAQTDLAQQRAEIETLLAEARRLRTERDQAADRRLEAQRLHKVAALVNGDNPLNTSLENWVLGAWLRDIVELANVRLAATTQQRFQLCVLDQGENRRGRWGLDLAVEDTVTGTRRSTAGLSGGELFQASLALALGMADVVMNQSGGVHIDALFIDEGFGSLDERSVERAVDLLDELRGRGAMVGVITHVPALLEALPCGVTVDPSPDGIGSTIHQRVSASVGIA